MSDSRRSVSRSDDLRSRLDAVVNVPVVIDGVDYSDDLDPIPVLVRVDDDGDIYIDGFVNDVMNGYHDFDFPSLSASVRSVFDAWARDVAGSDGAHIDYVDSGVLTVVD